MKDLSLLTTAAHCLRDADRLVQRSSRCRALVLGTKSSGRTTVEGVIIAS